MCDPPMGWKYGFPKPLPDEHGAWTEEQMDNWFIAEGYPVEELKFMKYCRYWETEIECS